MLRAGPWARRQLALLACPPKIATAARGKRGDDDGRAARGHGRGGVVRRRAPVHPPAARRLGQLAHAVARAIGLAQSYRAIRASEAGVTLTTTQGSAHAALGTSIGAEHLGTVGAAAPRHAQARATRARAKRRRAVGRALALARAAACER